MTSGSPASTPGRPSPLTGAQQLVWASQQLHPESPMYNMAYLFTIHGDIDEQAFAEAFGDLVADAEVLRTVIHVSDGVPEQLVVDDAGFELPVIDFTKSANPTGDADDWVARRIERPLDIVRSTFDAALLRIGERRYGWYLNQHHIVSDAWSFTILFERMEARYQQRIRGLEHDDGPLPSFRAYVDHEHGRAESPPPTTPADEVKASAMRLYGRSTGSARTENQRLARELSVETSDAIRKLAAEPGWQALTEDQSLFQIFGTALAGFLARVTDADVVRFGAPAHNRATAAFKRTPGLFMEVYPVEVDVGESPTFTELHAEVGAATASFLRAARPGSADSAANRSINVVLNYLTATFDSFDGSPVTSRWLHAEAVDAHHALRLQVSDFDETGRFQLFFDLNEDVFPHTMREHIADHFIRLLEAMLTDPASRIGTVDLLSDAERSAVLEAAEIGSTDPVASDVIEEFLGRVAAQPDDIALIDGERNWTYRELDAVTSRMASSFAPGTAVAIILPRSAEAVIAMLATLRAGAYYVPVDPSWPAGRTKFVIEDAGCALAVTAGDELGLDIAVPTLEVGDHPDHPADAAHRAQPGDLAYVLYTSGSTGEPKGVMIERAALANYVGWARSFYDRGSRLAFPLFSPLTFDLTVTSIFVPLTAGGSIVVYPESSERADLSVLDVFDQNAVDIVKLTPSHLALLQDRDLSGSRVRQLILGGEDLVSALAERIVRQFDGDVTIHNEYGPTEATVGCVVHTFDASSDREPSVPIGRAIAGMGALVVDDGGNLVPFGVPGELVVAGASVARGYLERPDLTADRFEPTPYAPDLRAYRTGDRARVRHDGVIEYLGRRDDQVKVRGARVELGEVEAALTRHEGVAAAAASVFDTTLATDGAEILQCRRCGLPSTYPGVSFDEQRVCEECRAYDEYEEKARVYFKPEAHLERILRDRSDAAAGPYDCLALLSGGKDSTYVLCRLVDMGFRVLAFTLDNGYISDQAKGNIRRVVEELGVDHVFASTPAMNEIFVDSLQRHANVCNGCFKTIYTLSVATAKEHGIPSIVTGLSRGQFFETRLTADLFTELTVSSEQIDANVLEARKAYHRADDAVHRLLDVSMFDDDAIFDEVHFVDFYRYVDVGLEDLYAYLDDRVPWVRPTDTGRSTNCLINDVGIYYHTATQGFHNYALPYSWDVRLGHKTRAEALEELDDDIDIAEVHRILDEIGFPDQVGPRESNRRLVAYYASPVEIPVPELKEHAASALPIQMVPSQYVRLDAIPLTRNGKVDRKALPDPGSERPVADTAFVAPASDTERKLAGIWSEVLGIDRVGVHDGFFDLGGDSIHAIQIVARAHRAGMPITIHDVFDSMTVEGLAASADSAAEQRSERSVGPVELTPIQRWFLETHEMPQHVHQAVTVGLDPGVAPSDVEQALQSLVDHHDALRQTFHIGEGGWSSDIAEAGGHLDFRVFEVDDGAGVDAAHAQLRVPFDLGVAPLLRAGFVTDGATSELVLVANHLVVDAVSWLHLVDDLDYVLASDGDLPAITSSIGDWVTSLGEMSSGIDIDAWAEIAAADVPGVGAGTGPRTTVRRVLPPDTTSSILEHASEWRFGVDELIAAGAATSIADLTGSPVLRLFVETHGRESDDPSVDVTRTVGWFTALAPHVVDVTGRSGLELAEAVRDQLRYRSDDARDYGVARYLHSDASVRASMEIDYADHVVLNHLGRPVGAHAARSAHLAGPIELVRPEALPGVFGMEVASFIDDDRLVIEWTAPMSDLERITRAADRMAQSIESIVAELSCASGGPADAAPSIDLDAGTLGKLAAALEAADGAAP